MIILSVDGASRRNGKSDCLSAGAVFIKHDGYSALLYSHEHGSTNQRGEIGALINALHTTHIQGIEPYIITDSEYMFNTVTKEWYKNWRNKGWITSSGAAVKNQDLWDTVCRLLDGLHNDSLDISMYCIKGHLMKMGKATAAKLIEMDPAGMALYKELYMKLETDWPREETTYLQMLDKFEEVNGVRPSVEVFKEMILCNMVSDLAAGAYIDMVDSNR